MKTDSQYMCDVEVIHKDLVDSVRKLMPDKQDFYDMANLYKMLADYTRVRILWALSCRPMCVCDLAVLLDMKKSAISHQLKFLRISNLVKYEKQGQIVFYSLADDHVKDIFEKGFGKSKLLDFKLAEARRRRERGEEERGGWRRTTK